MLDKSRRNFAIFIAIWITIYIILTLITYVKSIPIFYRATAYRLHYVLHIQAVLLIGTRYVWRQVFPPLLNPITPGAKSTKQLAQLPKSFIYYVQRISLGLFITCGHMSYFTNYIFISTDPYFFSIVCYTSLVAWVHLLLCLLFINTGWI